VRGKRRSDLTFFGLYSAFAQFLVFVRSVSYRTTVLKKKRKCVRGLKLPRVVQTQTKHGGGGKRKRKMAELSNDIVLDRADLTLSFSSLLTRHRNRSQNRSRNRVGAGPTEKSHLHCLVLLRMSRKYLEWLIPHSFAVLFWR
jgi:hypothetical protein